MFDSRTDFHKQGTAGSLETAQNCVFRFLQRKPTGNSDDVIEVDGLSDDVPPDDVDHPHSEELGDAIAHELGVGAITRLVSQNRAASNLGQGSVSYADNTTTPYFAGGVGGPGPPPDTLRGGRPPCAPRSPARHCTSIWGSLVPQIEVPHPTGSRGAHVGLPERRGSGKGGGRRGGMGGRPPPIRHGDVVLSSARPYVSRS